jgi:hypothetical protein
MCKKTFLSLALIIVTVSLIEPLRYRFGKQGASDSITLNVFHEASNKVTRYPKGKLPATPSQSQMQSLCSTTPFCTSRECRKKFSRPCNFQENYKGKVPVKADSVCIIVRTYAGNFKGFHHFGDLINSLKSQENKNWIAIIVNTDSVTLDSSELNKHISGDKRIVVSSLDCGSYDSRDAGYRCTDLAIQECPTQADWLLITNADNYYMPSFLSHLDTRYDIVAYDFFSRHVHVLDPDLYGYGCSKFSNGSCKRNTLRLCHTDLGSNVLRLPKFRCHNITFGSMVNNAGQDGQMMETLVYFGWKIKHVYECLFVHNPAPEYCVAKKGVWDSHESNCISDMESRTKLSSGKYEMANSTTFPCIQMITQQDPTNNRAPILRGSITQYLHKKLFNP